MGRFSKKKGVHDLLFNKLTLIIILIVCAYIAVSVYERYTVEREMANRRQEAEIEYQRLEERQKTLMERVEYLQDDTGIESEIRKNFDVAREGEQVIIIVDDDTEEEDQVIFTEGTSPSVAPQKPWYKFW